MAKLKHDINNSLVILKLGLDSIVEYLPKLVCSYELASEHDISMPKISEHQLELLIKLSQNLDVEVEKLKSNIAILSVEQVD